ncbi:MAG: hypothetical protein WC043_00465 [Pseudobdellovibrionaceae bacterium]
MSKKQKVLYLVDTEEYVKTNCFQRQLLTAFQKICPDMEILPFYPSFLWSIRSRFYNPHKYTKIISVMRQRNLYQNWLSVKKWLNGAPITIYDQDPWEGYIDTSSTKGVFEVLSQNLNVERYFVTAPFWAKYLSDRGHKSSWVRMGMNEEFCDVGTHFCNRPTQIGFKGALHPHRKLVFDEIEHAGIQVSIDSRRLDYQSYLQYLQTLQFFTHDESSPWICGGEEISRSTAMWVKSIETASQGAFELRNYHEEGGAYAISDIPLIQCYENPKQAPDIIKKISKMDRDEIYEIQYRSVQNIKMRNDWLNAAQRIIRNG